MKSFSFLLGLFLSITFSFAGADQGDVLKVLKGRYSFTSESGQRLQFVIRSTGKLQVLNSFDTYIEGSMNFMSSSCNFMMSGLPVAHIVIVDGSDEDSLDYHFLLTATGDDRDLKITYIHGFSTFNDGPNGLSDMMSSHLTLYKYSTSTKRYQRL